MAIERITVVFTADDAKKIREVQATLIKKSTKSVSFSAVVGILVNDGIHTGRWKIHHGFHKEKKS